MPRILAALVSLAVVLAAPVAPSTAHAAPAADDWSPRPATYPGTVKQADLAIPMSDGVVLRGDLELPADADGEPIDRRFPVIVTITAYNKASGGFSGGLTGGSPSYLVQRGYAQLTVDARGTGSSEGQWAAFSRREDKDAGEIVEWAHSRAAPVEQRPRRHERSVVPRHQPDLRSGLAADGPQGDLPAGARRRRLPRRGRVRRRRSTSGSSRSGSAWSPAPA